MKRYARLLRFARPYWSGWILIAGVTLLSNAFSLVQPWPMKILVDHVLGQEPVPGGLARTLQMFPGAATRGGLLLWVALTGLAIFAVNTTLEVILTWSWIRVGQRMVYDLARDLFARLQRRSLSFHSRSSVGDSMSRIADDSWCVHTIADTLLFTPVYAVITVGAAVGIMARMDIGLTLLSLLVAPALVAGSALLGRPIRTAAREKREVESRMQTHVQQTLAGIPVVQAFAQEDREHGRFQAFARAAIRAHRRSTMAGALYGLGTGAVTTSGTAVVLWAGAHHVRDGRLTVGGLLVFLAYLGTLQAQLKALTGIHGTLQATGASVERVTALLDTEQEVTDRPGAVPLPRARGHVRFDDVSFGYEPGRPVLHQLSLEARPGETIAIVGPTGAGKSTLVSLIPRFFDPWTGSLTLDGHDLRTLQLQSLRAQIALVLQEPFLFPLSIADNIAYGRPAAARAAIEAAARAAHAHPFIERLPDGYDTLVGERGATLSGGERQRLAIARALLKDAPVLILDEPTSALDAETEHLLLDALRTLMRGRTTFIIAHRLSTIRDADRIAVLVDGRLAETGPHADLLGRNGPYARLHGLQFADVSARPTGARQ